MNSTPVESTPLEAAAAAFAALGDPIRLRILSELAEGQLCVCELLGRVRLAPNLMSYHLRVLREAGLVAASRRGRWIDYRLAEAALDGVRAAIPTGSRS